MDENQNHIQTEDITIRKHREYRNPAIIFLSIAFVVLLACIGLFAWNIIRMRSYESDCVKMYGTVVDVKSHTSGSNHRTYRNLVISYTYEGKEYTFTDDVGRTEYGRDDIGKRAQIYVNPQHPDQAVMVMSSGSIAIGYSCCFFFFCFCYAFGMNFLLGMIGTSFKKRLCFVWGLEISLGIALFLLPWIGFPNSGFGEVFARVEGSIGIIVVCGLVLLAMSADGAIMHYVRSYERGH
ncbi:MAG: DUF3592 domain-containing protein [Clostridiales bacterium]|nr:DUF3592 domain-containing protein [Clostridiales bacterium]